MTEVSRFSFNGVNFNVSWVDVAPPKARETGIAFNFSLQLLDDAGNVLLSMTQLALRKSAENKWWIGSPYNLNEKTNRYFYCIAMDRNSEFTEPFMSLLMKKLGDTYKHRKARTTERRPVDAGFFQDLGIDVQQPSESSPTQKDDLSDDIPY